MGYLHHAYRPESTWVSQHCLSVNGKRKDISIEDLMQVAANMNIKNAKQIIIDIQRRVNNWSDYAARVNVSKDLTEGIKATLLKLV